MGDASDGIMGVPGIGAKLQPNYSMNMVRLAAFWKMSTKSKVKLENIKDNTDGIALDHQLASIICDLDLSFTYDDLKLQDPNVEALRNLYTELEFRKAAITGPSE